MAHSGVSPKRTPVHRKPDRVRDFSKPDRETLIPRYCGMTGTERRLDNRSEKGGMRDKADEIYFMYIGDRWNGDLRCRDGAGSKCCFPIAGGIGFISGMGL